jgi:hypothetical protein
MPCPSCPPAPLANPLLSHVPSPPPLLSTARPRHCDPRCPISPPYTPSPLCAPLPSHSTPCACPPLCARPRRCDPRCPIPLCARALAAATAARLPLCVRALLLSLPPSHTSPFTCMCHIHVPDGAHTLSLCVNEPSLLPPTLSAFGRCPTGM